MSSPNRPEGFTWFQNSGESALPVRVRSVGEDLLRQQRVGGDQGGLEQAEHTTLGGPFLGLGIRGLDGG
ncbi:hypothetical protein [Streptomyces kanamyceticus]|uniref:hypothetical protein n=1 Tax=Streptomyces kanamyceticus TaxID=1967 RepID=UPI0037DC2CBA